MSETKKRKRSRGNGEGSIYYSENKDLWVGQLTIGTDASGKQKRKTFYGKKRKDVKGKMDAFKGKTKEEQERIKNNSTFSTIASDIVETNHKLNITSDNSYTRALETIKQTEGHYIAEIKIQNIKEKDIKDYFIYLTKYSDSVIKKNYGIFNNVFKKAVVLNIISRNPLDDKQTYRKPKSRKPSKKVSALTKDEQKRFLEVLKNNPNTNYKTQMLLSIYTGMRMGEINALTLDDIDFNQKLIHVNKTLTRNINYKTVVGKRTKTYAGIRDIMINEVTEKILKHYINNEHTKNKDRILFFDNKKTYFTTSQVNMQFKRICKKYSINKGYDVNQHMLRHTFATRCIESGMPAKVLQKILGHADIKTTLNTYCDVFESYEKEHGDKAIEYLKDSGLIF